MFYLLNSTKQVNLLIFSTLQNCWIQSSKTGGRQPYNDASPWKVRFIMTLRNSPCAFFGFKDFGQSDSVKRIRCADLSSLNRHSELRFPKLGIIVSGKQFFAAVNRIEKNPFLKDLKFSGLLLVESNCTAVNSNSVGRYLPVWPEKNYQMSIKVVEKWFH